MPQVEVRELEPTRFEATVTHEGRTSTHLVIVPAGVGVPGASDEDVVEELIRLLLARGRPVPASFDVPTVLREDPSVLAEVERRLEEA